MSRCSCSRLMFLSLGLMAAMVWLAPGAAQAKPSLKKSVKNLGWKDVIKCKYKSPGKITHKNLKVWWTRQIECVRKGGVPGKPKIKKVSDGYVEYQKIGSKYHYDSFFPWGTVYIGIPNPKPELVVELIKKNELNWMGRSFDHGYIVGHLEGIKVAEEPRWSWNDPNTVTVRTTAVYRRKKGGWDVVKLEHTKLTTLKRDNMDAPWQYSGTSKTRDSSDTKPARTLRQNTALRRKTALRQKRQETTVRQKRQ